MKYFVLLWVRGHTKPGLENQENHSGTTTFKKSSEALLGCTMWREKSVMEAISRQQYVPGTAWLSISFLCTKSDISLFSSFQQITATTFSRWPLKSANHSLIWVHAPSYLNWPLSFCCLVNMCREQHGNQRALSDAASWIKVFRIGKSIHRSCPEDGLQGKWISRLNSILTRRFKESTNVDLCYL